MSTTDTPAGHFADDSAAMQAAEQICDHFRTASSLRPIAAIVGEAIDAEAQPLARMLQRLAEKTARANAIQHSGGTVNAEDWAELYQLTNEARGLLEGVTT